MLLLNDLKPGTRSKMDGLHFLSILPENAIPAAFLDPQYRGVLDKLKYGNEGDSRERRRAELAQMTEGTIKAFISGIDRVLTPSGYLFLWIDKFHLCTGFAQWCEGTSLEVVDLMNWKKGRIGMGYGLAGLPNIAPCCRNIRVVPRGSERIMAFRIPGRRRFPDRTIRTASLRDCKRG